MVHSGMLDHYIFINSHPIQYFAPLYQYLQQRGDSLETWYCSAENINGHVDKQFSTRVQWDIPLLEGYSFRFFRNWSWKPTIYGGFLGLLNPGLIKALFSAPKSIVIVHGWGYATHVLAIVAARLAGHHVCVRGESPLNQEIKNPPWKQFIKKMLLGKLLFRCVSTFLYIGQQNFLFYRFMGIGESRLLFIPYAVDNERFRLEATRLQPNRSAMRAGWGLTDHALVFLFVGKYITKKRPMDILRAFAGLSDGSYALVMVGEGELRQEMEEFIDREGLRQVYLTGFKNQSEIPTFYCMADVLVVSSGVGETWGLVVNEAMNFDLPLIVSETVGCGTDLVASGINGLLYPEGNIEALAAAMKQSAALQGKEGRKIIDRYSFGQIAKGLDTLKRG